MTRLRTWRAPRWSLLWIRRLFPGVWTQPEIDDINRRAATQHAALRPLID